MPGPFTRADMDKALDEIVRRTSPADPKDRKRIRIVRAATGLFLRHGYRRTSVDEIARAAGVAKGTLYLYFPAKAHILLHAVAEEERRYLSQFAEVVGGDKTPRERLRAYLLLTLTMPAEMPLMSRMLGADQELLHAFDELEPDMVRFIQSTWQDFTAGFLRDATGDRWTAEELHERATVLIAVSYCAEVLTSTARREGLAAERTTRLLADMLVDGIAPVPGEDPEP